MRLKTSPRHIKQVQNTVVGYYGLTDNRDRQETVHEFFLCGNAIILGLIYLYNIYIFTISGFTLYKRIIQSQTRTRQTDRQTLCSQTDRAVRLESPKTKQVFATDSAGHVWNFAHSRGISSTHCWNMWSFSTFRGVVR